MRAAGGIALALAFSAISGCSMEPEEYGAAAMTEEGGRCYYREDESCELVAVLPNFPPSCDPVDFTVHFHAGHAPECGQMHETNKCKNEGGNCAPVKTTVTCDLWEE